jgi:hypothetical protein
MQTLMTTADERVSVPDKLDSLSFGYLNYPKFSAPNGDPRQPNGFSVDLVKTIAHQLGINPTEHLHATKCKWSTFDQQLYRKEVRVVIDPVLRTPSRTPLEIVDYAKVRCFVLLYHIALEDRVKRGVENVAKALAASAESSGSAHQLQAAMQMQRALADIPREAEFFRIGEGLYEQDFLRSFGVLYECYKYNGDPITPIVEALERKEVVITDEPFALETLRRLRAENKHHFQQSDLLTVWSDASADIQHAINKKLAKVNYQCAGFALRGDDPLVTRIRELNPARQFKLLCETKSQDPSELGVQFIEEDGNDSEALKASEYVPPIYLKLIADGEISLGARRRVSTNHGEAPATCSIMIEGVDTPLSLAEMGAITHDWELTNQRRVELIEKKVARLVTPEERKELDQLQKLAWAKRQLVMPLPIVELAAIETDLRRRGLWREA